MDLQFTAGNCYGIIGANGAGKSTFLKILSGELEPSSGEVFIDKKRRMSVLKQDQFQYAAYYALAVHIHGACQREGPQPGTGDGEGQGIDRLTCLYTKSNLPAVT